ncbi:3-ketoacyl-ACP reductase [Alkalihalobacillus alcalophilus ATCC 27647 = CGMCC 1.3604]|uniref:3-ketoacyl-ACP reductase n=1 Tax=Alkalihalobacillus alcalophilus ATCC 27647 = CGMCC 1.3604 TaxID=1218173 RepID=A0A094WH39_ALKAL|nr:SDR family oxidoreductase [Alkalihalobacillus alcalophilus]KGA97099.1 oxidoreductase [Alkalihalobacillus alcalophilus ATCC 27647 = CGMCC 1.3604]MED1563068.1 SDR family oxidoreductase [Alkalihalobacillus alcalophilus]THG89852.1 3-ketoacyl-ACP reductase [Alkalihalobacillus alcalophilus ATCC 27647 = CGMCC 1.3604]
MDKQVVIVTGAANGIGKVVTKTYAEKGFIVFALDVNQEDLEKSCQPLIENHYEVYSLVCDVRSESEIKQALTVIKEQVEQIDILINNAGVSRMKSMFELTLEEWEDIIKTNLTSVFLLTKEVAKVMKKNQHGGRIVNIASTRAYMSEPNSEAYAASKGGIIALTHALAASLQKEKITVNSISPGWIHTGEESELRSVDHEQHFSKRVGTAADIARACLFLTDFANDFVNGENVTIDGGMTKKMIYEQ